MTRREAHRLEGSGRPRRGLTLVELVVAVAIIAILAALAVPQYLNAQTRAKVAAAAGNIRSLTGAMEAYGVDHGAYPAPGTGDPSDPFGVVAHSALASLTTPVAYISSAAMADPFGDIKVQGSIGITDMFGEPVSAFNEPHSLLYFSYPHVAELIGDPGLKANGFAVISVGPDQRDSFIGYLPFPDRLPANAPSFGIAGPMDTIYDPTNGVISRGDIAGFGGELRSRGLAGGGIP